MKSLIFSRKQIQVLICVWLAFMVSFVARLSWSSIMPLAITSLHFTLAEGAKYISVFYFGYLLTVLPGGILADKLGYRKMILGCLTSMVIFTIPMFFVESYYSGLILRFALGLFCGPLHASCMSAIGDYFSAQQRGRAVGLYMTASSFGVSFVNYFAPLVAKSYGWNYTFLAVAAIPALILIICLFGLKQKEVVPKVIHQSKRAEQNNSGSHILLQNLKTIITNRNIVLLALTGMFATGTTWGTTSWANQFMNKELAVPLVQAGRIMVIYGMAAMVSKPIAGFLSDILPIKANRLAALFIFLLSPALVLFVFTPSINLLYVTGAMLGVGAFSYSALTNMLAITTAPQGLRGTTVGFINVFNQLGSFVAPILLSNVVVTTGSYKESLLVLAIFPIIAAIALLFMKLQMTKDNSNSFAK